MVFKFLSTREQILEEITMNPWIVRYLPDEFKTYDFILEAVKRTGEIIKFVPESMKTHEFCAIARNNYPMANNFIPESLTLDLHLETLAKRDCSLEIAKDIVKKIPVSALTTDICVLIASRISLEFVPDELKTPDLCMMAVYESGGEDLCYIPDEKKTSEMCLEAMKLSCDSFEYIPEKLWTPEICREYFREGWNKDYSNPLDDTAKKVCNFLLKENKNYIPKQILANL